MGQIKFIKMKFSTACQQMDGVKRAEFTARGALIIYHVENLKVQGSTLIECVLSSFLSIIDHV